MLKSGVVDIFQFKRTRTEINIETVDFIVLIKISEIKKKSVKSKWVLVEALHFFVYSSAGEQPAVISIS